MSKASLFFLIVSALAGQALHASELFSPAPVDVVSVRTLPAFTVIATDTRGSLDAAWGHGFRLGARYAALARSGLNTPTILTFPDWDATPVAGGNNVHVLVQVLLDPLPDLPKVRDLDATLQQIPATTVACYALRGDYSPDSFVFGLKKIQDYLKTKNIPAVGAPRYLYYVTTGWMPSWWRIGEVEVPIAPGIQ